MYGVWHYDWLWLVMYQSLIDDVWHCRTELIMARLFSSPEIGLAFNVWEHSAWKVLVSVCKMVHTHTLWSQRRLRFGNNPKLSKCDHNRILLEHLRFLSCFGALLLAVTEALGKSPPPGRTRMTRHQRWKPSSPTITSAERSERSKWKNYDFPFLAGFCTKTMSLILWHIMSVYVIYHDISI